MNTRVNIKYLPKTLSKKDKKKQFSMITKSRKFYKKNKFYTRKNIKSFNTKPSNHIINAKKMYNVTKIGATRELSKKTGCSLSSLKQIIKKGEGAYYSSGSRPNQTPQSWGLARLASSLTAGKAGAVDYNILLKGCNPKSKGLKMANLSKKKYGYGTRQTKKTRP